MQKLKILSVQSIPKFIGEYFNKGSIKLDDIHNFSEILLNNNFEKLYDDKYIVHLEEEPKLIKFYLEKSKLDHYCRCKYEDELDISKSFTNECYKLKIDNDKIISATFAYDEKFNLLILNIG